MNDEPKSIWSRPWHGPAKVFGWLGILAAAVFLIICGFGFAEGGNRNISELLLVSLLFSVSISALVAVAGLFVRWLFYWRNLRWLLFGVACLVTLIALTYAVENWRGKRAWERHRAEWEAKGEKFTIAAWTPPSVPEEKNFALTPLLRPALEFSHGANGVVWANTNALERLKRTRADLSPGRSTNDQLVLGSLEKGTFADLAACREFYRRNTNYPQPAVAGTAAEDIGFALGKFEPEFMELRAAAVSRPMARYPIEYEAEPPRGILLPHLSHLKGLTQLTHLRATAALEAGRPAEALADLKVGFRISDSIRDEPLLIDHLVRISCLAINLQTVREGLVRHAWSEAQLADLDTYLRSVNLLAEYRLAMRGERACETSGLDYLRRQRFRSNPFSYLGDGDGGGAAASGLNPIPSGWFYQNMLTVSRLFQDHLVPVVDDKAHRVFPEVSENGTRAIEQLKKRPYTIFAKLLLPALGNAIRKSARMQTYVDEARVACAVERFRLANGKFPDTLEALTPRLLDAIPTDVIDGKPIRYRPKADGGYVLYSVGWNKTDDAGELVWKQGKTPSVDIEKGDWVWRYPAK
jgi:hypothetical protein